MRNENDYYDKDTWNERNSIREQMHLLLTVRLFFTEQNTGKEAKREDEFSMWTIWKKEQEKKKKDFFFNIILLKTMDNLWRKQRK